MNSRLAPGLVWPVRSQELHSALGEMRERIDVAWLFWIKQAATTPMAATWAPLTNLMPDRPEGHHGLKVWIYPIAKQDHLKVRGVIQSMVVPDLVRWCREALAAPEGWALMRHERRWSLSGDTATAKERDGVAALRW